MPPLVLPPADMRAVAIYLFISVNSSFLYFDRLVQRAYSRQSPSLMLSFAKCVCHSSRTLGSKKLLSSASRHAVSYFPGRACAHALGSLLTHKKALHRLFCLHRASFTHIGQKYIKTSHGEYIQNNPFPEKGHSYPVNSPFCRYIYE